MKTINDLREMTPFQRANLIHRMFPQEIPGLLDFLAELCASLKETQAFNDILAAHSDFGPQRVHAAVLKTEGYLVSHRRPLKKWPGYFAQRLFCGDRAAVSVYGLGLYCQVRKHPNVKFVQAFTLLFT